MTPKQILDSFSDTLMQDERILSAPERALLATLLQHAKSATGENQETEEAVRAVIASAVGETVAQRAFAVLGGSIVERILEGGSLAQTDLPEIFAGKKSSSKPGKPPLRAPSAPSSPSTPSTPSTPGAPGHPGVTFPTKPPQGPDTPGVREPTKAPPGPMRTPGAPGTPGTPGGPDTPGGGGYTEHKVEAKNTVEVLERPPHLPARCVVLDEFLAPQELEQLTRFTLEHESGFNASEVISPNASSGIVNYEHRRSRVLMDLEQYQDLVLERIKAVLPQALEHLGMEEFSLAGAEVQVTASNDGDFFRFHNDNGSQRVAARHLTFVYFFHREPQPFEGGDLRIHDARLEDGRYISEGSYQTIVPRQNQIVFFPCELMHEITPVKCPSQLFADSRFTLNGWLRR